MRGTVVMLGVEAEGAKREALHAIERAESELRQLRERIAEGSTNNISHSAVKAATEACLLAQRFVSATLTLELLAIDAEAGA